VTVTEQALAIAGGDPAALMLAGELAPTGISIAIGEQWATEAHHPADYLVQDHSVPSSAAAYTSSPSRAE
jgi:hypothetical protein